MKLLIDECIDGNLRFHFPVYDCQTARFAGLTGLRNGQLLAAAEALGFDVLITVDQHISEQQNLAKRSISVLIFSAPASWLSDLCR